MLTPRDLTNTAERLNDDIATAERQPDNPHQYDLLRVPRHLSEGLFVDQSRRSIGLLNLLDKKVRRS